MNPCLEKHDYTIQIRDKLRKDGVKLWLPPYLQISEESSEEDIKKLAQSYSSTLNISLEMCCVIMRELQANALENLKERKQFEQSGLATVKIKVVHKNSPSRIFRKEIMLSRKTLDLKTLIREEVNFSGDRIKLICAGKVLNDSDPLGSQGLRNGYQIMAVLLSDSPTEIIDNEKQMKDLEDTKTDSKLLALDNTYMDLEDQFGNPVKIPLKEKQNLVVAMTLHAKGKTALKRKEYTKALIFLLEADQEFRQCNSQLLQSVDNYALLDLDIAWCYLCLESFPDLPEAFERLKKCEEKFVSTYGENLERVIALKGTPGNEQAVLLRLHLLQAIVLYHQNKRSEALSLIKRVHEDLRNLKVDEEKVLALIELGFSPAEATLGLRVTKGDVESAANYINENKEKRAQSRKKAQAQHLLEKERKKLGKCKDGKQYIDPQFVKILVNMGYNKENARIALRETNNIISDSIQFIQEHPEAGPSGTRSTEVLALVEDRIPELVDAGFDPRMAKLALMKYAGDITKAVEELLDNDGIVTGDLSSIISLKSIDNIKKKMQEEEIKDEALERLKQDISLVDDDYLDIDLVEEEVFLKTYLALLEK